LKRQHTTLGIIGDVPFEPLLLLEEISRRRCQRLIGGFLLDRLAHEPKLIRCQRARGLQLETGRVEDSQRLPLSNRDGSGGRIAAGVLPLPAKPARERGQADDVAHLLEQAAEHADIGMKVLRLCRLVDHGLWRLQTAQQLHEITQRMLPVVHNGVADQPLRFGEDQVSGVNYLVRSATIILAG
jgi:hypothetical protein